MLQTHTAAEFECSFMPYQQDKDTESQVAVYHDIGELEAQGHWLRCRCANTCQPVSMPWYAASTAQSATSVFGPAFDEWMTM